MADPSHMLKEEGALPSPASPSASPPPSQPSDAAPAPEDKDADVMNAVLDATDSPKSTPPPAPTETGPAPTESEPTGGPPPHKKRFSRMSIAVAVLLFLVLTLPLIVYLVSQQQQLAELRGRAITGVYPTTTIRPTTTSGPTPGPTSGSASCNDCGGFNQGQCGSGDFANCNPGNSPCEGGMVQCDGGCYPSNYHSCKDWGRAGCYPPETPCSASDPCANVNCPAGQYCNGGACVTGQGGDNIVSCLCSSCGTDRRCDTGCSVGTHGYSNPCGQVDSCDKNPDGTINYSTCRAIKLCDSSCSGGGGSSGGGSSGGGSSGGHSPTPTSPPAGRCETIRVYDAAGVNITDALRNGTRRLSIGETVTLATPKGSATKARFRIQGITQFAENNPSLTTNSEYRIAIQIPSTITQAQGSFEAEVFINGNWK